MKRRISTFVSMNVICCIFAIAVALVSAKYANAVPITYNFQGRVTSLDVTAYYTDAGVPDPNGPQHYDLGTLPVGPDFVGELLYDPVPLDSSNPNIHQLIIEIFFSSGHIASGGMGAGPVTYDNGVLTMQSTIYFDTNQGILCDPVIDVSLDSNTMTGSVLFGFTDTSGGVLTGAIDKYTSVSDPAVPVPEPATIILLFTGMVGMMCAVKSRHHNLS